MQPRIDRTAFGSITIEGAEFEHDVIIRLNGRPEKRKKKLSKAIYPQDTLKGCGTSHIISLAEAELDFIQKSLVTLHNIGRQHSV